MPVGWPLGMRAGVSWLVGIPMLKARNFMLVRKLPFDKRARDLGMLTIQWSADPQNWARPGTDAIASRLLAQASPGGILLMHDGGGDRSQTIAALPTVAYDTPVAREYLGASGKYAARGSVDSLLENLLFLLDHPIEAHAMGERLRQRAIEQFEWQRAGLQISHLRLLWAPP